MDNTDFMKFVAGLASYSDVIEYDEAFDDELFRVTVRCGDEVILDHHVIKCKCETPDEIRQYVYEQVVEELYKIGLDVISNVCNKKKGS